MKSLKSESKAMGQQDLRSGESSVCTPVCVAGQTDPDLARLMAAWPDLSATAKRMILAALEAARPGA
jgi:hypothetical protein